MAHRPSCVRSLLSALTFVAAQVHAQPCPSSNALHSDTYGLSGQDGIFFNITASEPVTIACFQTYFSSNSQDLTNVYIWYRHGSHIGLETSPGAWSLIDSIIGFPISANQTLLQHIPIAVNVDIAANDTAAFYITNGDLPGMTNTGVRFDPATGDTGIPVATDGIITIHRAAGSFARWTIYSGSWLFSGEVRYNTGTTGAGGILSTSPFALFPNPAADRLTLALDAALGSTEVRILDRTGRLVQSGLFSATGPAHLDVSMLSAGVYVAQAKQGDALRSVPFIKE